MEPRPDRAPVPNEEPVPSREPVLHEAPVPNRGPLLNQEGSQGGGGDGYTPPPLSAESLRELGSEAFKTGAFSQAEKHWTEAIEIEQRGGAEAGKAGSGGGGGGGSNCGGDGSGLSAPPLLAVLFSNRSAARLAQNNARAALADALSAVGVAPKWARARSRQAAALLALGRTEGAALALSEGLKIEPGSNYMRGEWAKLKARARAEGMTMPEVTPPPAVAAAAVVAPASVAAASGISVRVAEGALPLAVEAGEAAVATAGGGAVDGEGRADAPSPPSSAAASSSPSGTQLGLGGLEYAREAFRLGQPDTALRILTREIAISPTDPALYLERAATLAATGRHGGAMEDAHTASYLKPGEPRAFLQKGRAQASECFSLSCRFLPSPKLPSHHIAGTAIQI